MSVHDNPPASVPRPFGRYELLDVIGSGGTGIIHRARQPDLDRFCAVKMLKTEGTSDGFSKQHLQDEAKAAASLDHPNIVGVHEVGEIDGQLYFSMELVEGQDLHLFVRGRLVSSKTAATYVRKIADAIHYAHERGVLHCDLKPANILIDQRDEPRITDFGLARRIGRDLVASASGLSGGSPNFMAPEQVSSRFGTVGVATDVFGIGATLYYLLTDRPPFRGETLQATLAAVTETEPVRPRTLRPGISVDLETICLKCLEKRPSRRYRTAHEVADELERFLNDLPIHARQITWMERGWRLARRHLWLTGLIGTTAALILLIAVVSTVSALAIRESLNVATQERTKAESARRRAEASELNTRKNLYSADMALALQALSVGNRDRVRKLIGPHRPAPGEPDLRGWEWRFLWTQSSPDSIGILGEHPYYLERLHLVNGGRELLSGDGGYHLKLWDLASGRLLKDFQPHSASSPLSVVDPKEGWVAVTDRLPQGTNNRVRILQLPTGTTNLEFEVTGFAHAEATTSDGQWLWMVSDQNATAYSVTTGQAERRVRFARENPQGTFAASTDGRWIAWGSVDGEVILGDAATGQPIKTLGKHEGRPPVSAAPNTLRFSPDSGLLASGAGDGVVRLWNTQTLEPDGVLSGHTDMILVLTFSADGKHLLSSGREPFILVWNLPERRLEARLHNDSGILTDLIFLPGEKEFASAGHDGRIRRWPILEPQRFSTFTNFPSGYGLADFSSDGSHFVWTKNLSPEEGGGLQPLFSTESILRFDRDTNDLARAFVVASDHRVMGARYRFGGQVEVQDYPESHRHQIQIPNWKTLAPGMNAYAEFSSDGSRLLIVDYYNGIHILSSAGLEVVRRVEGNGYHAAALSRDGRYFASDNLQGRSIIGPVSAGPLMEVDTGRTPVQTVVFNSDSSLVAFTTLTSEIEIFETRTGALKFRLNAPMSGLINATFSPDNLRLAGGGFDGWVCFWDLTTGREIGTYTAHRGVVAGLRFMSDGTLVSLGSDAHRRWPSPSLKEIDASPP